MCLFRARDNQQSPGGAALKASYQQAARVSCINRQRDIAIHGCQKQSGKLKAVFDKQSHAVTPNDAPGGEVKGIHILE